MTRPERNGPRDFGDPKRIGAYRTVATERLEVHVLSDVEVFDNFVLSVYDSVVNQWAATHPTGVFPVSVEDFTLYSYTAVKTRVSRVRDERFSIRCDASWVLPTPIASVLAKLGRVEYDRPVLTVWPKWNIEHDGKLLSYDRWELISRTLRAIERDPLTKLVFAHAIEGGKSGDESLMNLIPVRDAQGRVTPDRITGYHDVDPIAAAVYLVLGLWPEQWDGNVLPSHPLLLPHSYVESAAVLMTLHRLAEASSGS
jgi:hypothetical protein